MSTTAGATATDTDTGLQADSSTDDGGNGKQGTDIAQDALAAEAVALKDEQTVLREQYSMAPDDASLLYGQAAIEDGTLVIDVLHILGTDERVSEQLGELAEQCKKQLRLLGERLKLQLGAIEAGYAADLLEIETEAKAVERELQADAARKAGKTRSHKRRTPSGSFVSPPLWGPMRHVNVQLDVGSIQADLLAIVMDACHQ